MHTDGVTQGSHNAPFLTRPSMNPPIWLPISRNTGYPCPLTSWENVASFLLMSSLARMGDGAVSICESCTFKKPILGSDDFRGTKTLNLEFTPNNNNERAERQHIVAM